MKSESDIFVVHSDLAPLQGFSEDGLQDGLDALERSLPRWLDHELPLIDLRKGLSDLWEAFVDVEPDLNALSWCMFGLCVQTHARVRGNRARDILNSETFVPKEVALEFQSSAALKMKFHSEADLPKILSAMENQAIRLDSNCVFSGPEVLRIAETLPKEKIVYWEEPTHDSDAVQALRKMGVRVAKDESLMSSDWKSEECDAYVVKPTVLGWKKTDAVIRHAQSKDLSIAISTAYESSIGRDFLRELACATGPKTTLGLGTPKLFTNDIKIEEIADAI